MGAELITCRFAPAAGPLRLRELTGRDEQMVTDCNTAVAIELLDRLAVTLRAEREFRAGLLTTSDRDRLLAAVYERTFGDRVESTTRCTQCASLFDLDFSMSALRRVLDTPLPDTATIETDGSVKLSEVRFRLPTGDDEMAVMGLGSEEAERLLRERCPIEGSLEQVEAAMEEVAPILDQDLDAFCPECRASQKVHFDVQFYLLRAIEQGRKQLLRDVHTIASAYQWHFREILELPRTERQIFVHLIDQKRGSAQMARA